MPFIAPELIIQAKQMDLLTYLKNYEPYELVKFSGNTYCTRTHDSLKISNGKWCWFSRGIGGRTALDYLIKVREIPFIEAVEMIVGQAAIQPPAYERAPEKSAPKVLLIDEFHVVFENEYSGNFFNSAWRQFRKRNAYPTAITQNVEYLLDSVQASTMLSNSEFIIMLNQAASDREKLAKLLNISKEQMSYVTNADAGCGLVKYGSALVPFVNRWPRQTKLYDLMTTRPGEGVFGGEKQEVQE